MAQKIPWKKVWNTYFYQTRRRPAGLVYIWGILCVCLCVCVSHPFSPWSSGRWLKFIKWNPLLFFHRSKNRFKNEKKSLPQVDEVAKNSRKSRKFAKMAKLDGLNEVGDKNLIFQNDRLATATQKKKNTKKYTNRICKKYKYTLIPTKIARKSRKWVNRMD